MSTQQLPPTVNPYDEVPYSSYPYPQSHPAHLAAVGTLYGLQPVPLHSARVLELGCAAGGNLLPLAAFYPQATFLGIDLSSKQVQQGQQTLARAGLTNIELRQADISSISLANGQFDYILCHGVYSWVPTAIQQKILDICGTLLSPQGIAFISYNTYPGWHLRGIIRDLMNYHVQQFQQPQERVGRARALLDFLAKTVPEENNPYGMLLRREAHLIEDKDDSYILHEHLEENNHPVYFHEFAKAANQAGLQFLAESDWGMNVIEDQSSKVAKLIQQPTYSRVEYEQYSDFLQNRTFRQSLLCHANHQLTKTPQVEQLTKLELYAQLKIPNEVNLDSKQEVEFIGPLGKLTTKTPHIKVALHELTKHWPCSLSFQELANLIHTRLFKNTVLDKATVARNNSTLAQGLLDCASRRFISLTAQSTPLTRSLPEQPLTTTLIRAQAATSNLVTNGLHQLIRLTDLGRHVLQLCDGTRNQQQMLAVLGNKVQQGELVMLQSGTKIATTAQAEQALASPLQETLRYALRDGLLIPNRLS